MPIMGACLRSACDCRSMACINTSKITAVDWPRHHQKAVTRGTSDPERCDVFSKIRQDFDAAGVAQSGEEILHVMTELMLKAGNHTSVAPRDSFDGAAVSLARHLISQ